MPSSDATREHPRIQAAAAQLGSGFAADLEAIDASRGCRTA
jgi:hypothetical protein